MPRPSKGDFVIHLPTGDLGRVKSANPDEPVYIVCSCAGEWDKFENYTGQSCASFDLAIQRGLTEYVNKLEQRVKILQKRRV